MHALIYSILTFQLHSLINSNANANNFNWTEFLENLKNIQQTFGDGFHIKLTLKDILDYKEQNGSQWVIQMREILDKPQYLKSNASEL